MDNGKGGASASSFIAASILVARHGWHPKSIGTAAISACGLLPNGCTKFRHQPEPSVAVLYKNHLAVDWALGVITGARKVDFPLTFTFLTTRTRLFAIAIISLSPKHLGGENLALARVAKTRQSVFWESRQLHAQSEIQKTL